MGQTLTCWMVESDYYTPVCIFEYNEKSVNDITNMADHFPNSAPICSISKIYYYFPNDDCYRTGMCSVQFSLYVLDSLRPAHSYTLPLHSGRISAIRLMESEASERWEKMKQIHKTNTCIVFECEFHWNRHYFWYVYNVMLALEMGILCGSPFIFDFQFSRDSFEAVVFKKMRFIHIEIHTQTHTYRHTKPDCYSMKWLYVLSFCNFILALNYTFVSYPLPTIIIQTSTSIRVFYAGKKPWNDFKIFTFRKFAKLKTSSSRIGFRNPSISTM